MKDNLTLLKTAKLAKERGFNWIVHSHYTYYLRTQISDNPAFEYAKEEISLDHTYFKNNSDSDFSNSNWIQYAAPTQSLLQKWIRETRGVHISIDRSASGWYWIMCKADGGTNLGYSEYVGTGIGGTWETFESALEHAIQCQLSYDLPETNTSLGHWSIYAQEAIKHFKTIK